MHSLNMTALIITTTDMWHYLILHSGSALVSLNEVNLRWVQLVLGWMTMSKCNSRCGTFISVCDQPLRSTQPGHSFMGRCNEYQPKGAEA